MMLFFPLARIPRVFIVSWENLLLGVRLILCSPILLAWFKMPRFYRQVGLHGPCGSRVFDELGYDGLDY